MLTQPPKTGAPKDTDRALDYLVHTKIMGLKYYDKAADVPITRNQEILSNPHKKTYVTSEVWNEIFLDNPLMNIELVPYYSSVLNCAFDINAPMAEKGFNTKAEQKDGEWVVGFYMEPLAPQSPQCLITGEKLARAVCLAALGAIEDKVKKDLMVKEGASGS